MRKLILCFWVATLGYSINSVAADDNKPVDNSRYCVYEGKLYSQGSEITAATGTVLSCDREEGVVAIKAGESSNVKLVWVEKATWGRKK